MSGIMFAIVGASGAPGVINGSLPNESHALAAGIQLTNDGTYSYVSGLSGNWVSPASTTVAAYYQVKSVITSGSLTTDPSAGSYIDCSTTRTWAQTGSGGATLTLTFREKASGIVRHVQTGLSISVP